MKKNKKIEKTPEKTANNLADKAKLAMKHKFYLEASVIMSSLLEKRLKKLLVNLENQLPGPGFSLEQSIKRVKYLHVSSKCPDLNKHVEIGLIDETRNWKNQRNEILKDIPDIHVSEARLERMAMEGARLLKEWKKAAKAFKSA